MSASRALAGGRIRKQRAAVGLSQRRLAELAGISNGILSEIENGIAPSMDFLGCVNQALREEAFKKMREILDVLEDRR